MALPDRVLDQYDSTRRHTPHLSVAGLKLDHPIKPYAKHATWWRVPPDFANAANQKFMAEFEKEYKRIPTLYASQGYDAAQLINAAVRDVKGKLDDREALRKALKAAKFDSVRGPFKFNTNQYPIQNYYVRTVGSDGKGGLINKSFNEPILKNHGDAYVQSCPMK